MINYVRRAHEGLNIVAANVVRMRGENFNVRKYEEREVAERKEERWG